MRQKPGIKRNHGEKFFNDIGWATYIQCLAEERIRIVLDGLKGEGATLTPKRLSHRLQTSANRSVAPRLARYSA